jgi:hypothetical protein
MLANLVVLVPIGYLCLLINSHDAIIVIKSFILYKSRVAIVVNIFLILIIFNYIYIVNSEKKFHDTIYHSQHQ